MASVIRTLTDEYSCMRNATFSELLETAYGLIVITKLGASSGDSALASSTVCMTLALSVEMNRDPSTTQGDQGTVDISYSPIVSNFALSLVYWLG